MIRVTPSPPIRARVETRNVRASVTGLKDVSVRFVPAAVRAGVRVEQKEIAIRQLIPSRIVANVTPVSEIRVSVNFGSSAVTSTSMTSGTGVPSGGSDGDWYFRTTTKAWYNKSSGTWNVVGYLASSVTDTEAKFICPDATERGTILNDP